MSTYYRISDATQHELSLERFAAMQANGKAADLRLYIVDPQPTPSATQYVENSPVVVGPVEAHKTWTLRDKPAELIAFEQEALARTAEVEQIRQVLAALKNGTGTAAERLTRLERVVFQLAKDILA